MLLHINTLSGCLPPIEVPPDATTRELKRLIHEACPETASKRLRVMQRHQKSDEFAELDQNNVQLSSCGVSGGCELSLVIDEYHAVDRTIVDQCLKKLSKSSLTHPEADAISAFTAAINRCNGTLDLRQSRDRFPSDFPAQSSSHILSTMVNSLNSSGSAISRLNLSANVLTETFLPLAKESLASNLTITDLNLNGCDFNNEDALDFAEIVASNTTIQKLDISENQFKSGAALICSALVRNHAITDLDMSMGYDNRIPCPQLPTALSSMITSNVYIQKLNLSGMGLSEDCIKQMAEALQTNRTITDLNISYNDGTPTGMAALTKMIASNSTISKLAMCGVSAAADFTEPAHSLIEIQLYKALQCNCVITDLEMECYYFSSDDAANAFAGIIASNTTITRINLPSIHHTGAQWIFNALTWNRCLTDVTARIDMMHANLETKAKAFEALSRMIRLNSRVVRLDLHNSDTESPDLSIALADALLQNSTIQELDLGNCCLGFGFGHPFAKAIQSNSTLSKLCLKGNLFSHNEIRSIANALEHNRTITEADFNVLESGSGSGTSGADTAHAIARMIARNFSIVCLNLSGFSQYFSDDAFEHIAAAFKSNTTITSIDLSGCLQIGHMDREADVNVAALALADMIMTNKTIVKLNLDDNWFESEGLISIADALKTNASITEIDVCSQHVYDISDEVVLAFCDIFQFNQTLKSISCCFTYKADQFQDSTNETFQRTMLQYPQFKCPRAYLF